MADLLLEIGLEEVPARMLAAAQAELGARVQALLVRERLLALGAGDGAVTTYSTPRRLAVLVRGVAPGQPDAEEQLTGPAWAIAFKDGAPSPAGYAFAKKAGVGVDQLRPLATAKGDYASVTVARPGRPAMELLPELLPKEITALSWPKPMYWRAGKPERFVRPVKWLVALLDEAVVPVAFGGVQAGNNTYGHRVLHGAAPVPVAAPAAYAEGLRKSWVEVDVAARRQSIRKALDAVTRTVAGARWREDEALVDTVTHLTEWPSVVLGSFEPAYLSLPEEVLVTVMRDHQKYFALEGADGRLLPHFLTVLNTATDAAGEAVIRHGNERVLRARFNDARFFWDFDQKTTLEERVPLLEKVTFHKDLGSYAVKTERTRAIAEALAVLVASRGAAVDRAALGRAVTLAKVDLTTELVKEFTELQGIVGGLYVRHAARPIDPASTSTEPAAYGAGETAGKVADAIYTQYLPASMGDPIPPTLEGQLLGLADRTGTIVDMFGLGLAPSGSKDPYALRRAANALIKILAVAELPITLAVLLAAASAEGAQAAALAEFLHERLSFYLREAEQGRPDVVSAVLAAGADDVPDAVARMKALAAVQGSDDLAAIAAAWKRTKNILRQAREKQLAIAEQPDAARLGEAAERALWEQVQRLAPTVEEQRRRQNYRAALEAIATLRPHVDRFFDETMVLVDDAALRANRLALLQAILTELGRIADFSELNPSTQEAV